MLKVLTITLTLIATVGAVYHCGRSPSTLCLNGGTCDLGTGECTDCDPFYSGYNCAVNENETSSANCSSNPCENGGTCWAGESTMGAIKCLCPEEWTGDMCETRRYQLECIYTGDGMMSMTIIPDGPMNGKIYILGKENETSCEFTGNPPTLANLGNMDTTCGPTTNSGTERKRKVMVQGEDGRISAQDEIVTFICGTSDSVEISDNITVTVVANSFIPVTKSLSALDEDMDMMLMTSDSVADTVVLGTKIKVEVALSDLGMDKFEGILLENCWASPNSDGSSPKYFIEDFCPHPDLETVMNDDLTRENGTVMFSFYAFQFSGTTDVYITCDVLPCEDYEDCAEVDCDGSGTGGGLGRKKRQADDEPKTLQRSLQVEQSVALALANLVEQENQPSQPEKACSMSWEMSATVVALSVALAIVLFICIFLIVKAIVSRKSDTKAYKDEMSETSSTARFPNLPTMISDKC